MQDSSTPVHGRLKCAIYARISDDKRGEELGVQRQEELCRQLANRLGWEVTCVEVDNSISAYSGKPRPAYKQLVQRAKDREIQAVLAWNLDRLYRRPRELEDYIDLVEATGLQTETVIAGRFDLNTPMGRAFARQAITFAMLEVEQSKARVLAAKLQAAKAGKPSGGNRAYGYRPGGMFINPDEAPYVREAISRFIAGDSWRSIALDFNRRGIATAFGNKWSSINVANMATLPRHAGYREHHGILYDAVWEPIISRDTYEQLQLAIKRGQDLHGRRTYARKHLLSGFVFCGSCGERMHIVNTTKRKGGRKYSSFMCRKKNQFGEVAGCGKVSRQREPIEELVIEALLYRLDTPDLGALLQRQDKESDELRDLLRERESQSARLQEILEAYSTGDLTLAEWKTAKVTAQSKLDQLDKKITKLTSHRAIAAIPVGQTVREAWEKGSLQWRRQLLDMLVERVDVHPKELGDQKVIYNGHKFNPNRVEIQWKA